MINKEKLKQACESALEVYGGDIKNDGIFEIYENLLSDFMGNFGDFFDDDFDFDFYSVYNGTNYIYCLARRKRDNLEFIIDEDVIFSQKTITDRTIYHKILELEKKLIAKVIECNLHTKVDEILLIETKLNAHGFEISDILEAMQNEEVLEAYDEHDRTFIKEMHKKIKETL